MNNKITFPKLAALLADKSGRSKRFSEDFIREFFALISETLEDGETVKIKGFGSFRLSRVEPRMSVDVTTGQPIEIAGHTKVVFTPSKELGETINAPFEVFSPIEIDENFDLSKIEGGFDNEQQDVASGVVSDAPSPDAQDNLLSDKQELASDEPLEADGNVDGQETITFAEAAAEIDASLPKSDASDQESATKEINVIDFTTANEEAGINATDTQSIDIIPESDLPAKDQGEEQDRSEENAEEAEDYADELEEPEGGSEPLQDKGESLQEQDEEIEEATEFSTPDSSDDNLEFDDNNTIAPPAIYESAGETTLSEEPSNEYVADFDATSEKDDDSGQETSISDSQTLSLISDTSNYDEEDDVPDEVQEVEELQPEFYDEDDSETSVKKNRRRQWLKGFMVGIAAAIGAILITFLVWYFFTSPNFKEKEQPREVPDLFSQNNRASAEDIAEPATDSEKDSASETPTEEDADIPDAGKTDVDVAKTVATVASDAIITDTISTTRYLITMAKEHYGNMNLWPYIYEENKGKLGDPDRIRPGTTVVIPPLSKYGIDPKNPKDIEKAKRLGKDIYGRFGK